MDQNEEDKLDRRKNVAFGLLLVFIVFIHTVAIPTSKREEGKDENKLWRGRYRNSSPFCNFIFASTL